MMVGVLIIYVEEVEQPSPPGKAYSVSAPYGVDGLAQKKEEFKDENAYQMRKMDRRSRKSHDFIQPDESLERGAGISYKELKKKRDHEYTLKNEERRNDDFKARSIFDKSDKISNTLAFRVKKSDVAQDAKSHIGSTRAQHNMMLANKVKGERHFDFGNEENKEVNAVEIAEGKLPYGEPSKN